MSTTPHDALFKTIFSQPEHAAGELRLALPPSLVAHIDFATLTLRPGSFVDEALRERSTDLLFSVQLAGRYQREEQGRGDPEAALARGRGR
jgi:predicted transposase YdaD